MITPHRLGYHQASKREVHLLCIDALHSPFALPAIEGRHFTCFCAVDAQSITADEIGRFCRYLLQLGCAYFRTWGPDCERVHDIMDQEIVGDDPPRSEFGFVMTTWHAEDSLKEALEFFLHWTQPDEEFAPDGCATALIISVGRNDWASDIDKYVSAEIEPVSPIDRPTVESEK